MKLNNMHKSNIFLYRDIFNAVLFSKLQLFYKANILPDLPNQKAQYPIDKVTFGEAIKHLDLADRKIFLIK